VLASANANSGPIKLDPELLNQTVEQLSIFQNKETVRQVDLEGVQKMKDQVSQEKYVAKLEMTVENLNKKVAKLKSDCKQA
jgi:hypothetical protein